jgi:O-antigen ligase
MDDQFLGMLWQTGALGLLAYLWMIVSPIAAAWRARRARDPDMAGVALAASASCVAFLVVNWLFDALSFVQAPYIFFIVAALCTVASGAPGVERVPNAALVPRRTTVATA